MYRASFCLSYYFDHSYFDHLSIGPDKKQVLQMRVYFIRHAQSNNNASQSNDSVNFDRRIPDPELTTVGTIFMVLDL